MRSLSLRHHTGQTAQVAAPKVVKDLATLASKVGITTTDILEGVEALQDAVAKVGGNGVLIVIDELGKFLEYEARHYGANDIFLLQALAEHAGAGHKANLTLVVSAAPVVRAVCQGSWRVT
jgi:hypothetical protein